MFCNPLLFLLLLFFLSSACSQPLPPALREQQSNLWLCRAMHQELAGGQGGGGARHGGGMLSPGCPIAPLHAALHPCLLCQGHSQTHPKLLGCTPCKSRVWIPIPIAVPPPRGGREEGGTGARQQSPSAHCTALQQGRSLWLDCPRQGSPPAMLMPENSLYFFFSPDNRVFW